uniref:Uncharacterized protein n=1 Tax=Arundo donax TaxID=35708 RepID=A0A0A9AXU2_ARUDO
MGKTISHPLQANGKCLATSTAVAPIIHVILTFSREKQKKRLLAYYDMFVCIYLAAFVALFKEIALTLSCFRKLH